MLVSSNSSVIQLHLLLQLGDRFRRLRESQGLSTVETASRLGISRATLRAVEAGDPTPSIGTYLIVMSALGILGDLALLVDEVTPPVTGSRICKVSPSMKKRCDAFALSLRCCSRPRQFFKSGWMLETYVRQACGLSGKTSWSIASGVRHWGEPTERRN